MKYGSIYGAMTYLSKLQDALHISWHKSDLDKTPAVCVFCSVAKMNEQISSILAGFGAYSTTMKHHSLLFMRQQEAFDELKASNDRKDTKIAELENSTAGTTIIIEEQQATIARMATTIKDLERKIEKKPSLTGTNH